MSEDKGSGAVVAGPASRRAIPWRRLLMIAGPGLIVMLADTDVGSVITAAQSGAQWGYQLLPLQFLLIPVLYMVQELALRLGVNTGKGYAELVSQHFGRLWAVLTVGTVIVSCFGALVTEIGGLAGAGALFGIAAWQTAALAVGSIFIMVLTGSYHSVERIAICFGLFELAFFVVAWHARPDAETMLSQGMHIPFGNRNYFYLLAANLGTCVMPWTVFYQQSAIADKGLVRQDLGAARLETLLGAVLCQLITAAILIAAAAALGGHGTGVGLQTIPEIANALIPALGDIAGRIIFALGLSGAAFVAIIVVCLTPAWAIGEVTGLHHSLDHSPAAAPWFYGIFGLILLAGGVLVGSGIDLVRFSIAVGVVNAALLPVVLGVLFRLSRVALAESDRPNGIYAAAVAIIFCATAILAIWSGVAGIAG